MSGYELEETQAVEQGASVEEAHSPSTPDTLEGQEQVTEKTAQAEVAETVTEKTAEEIQEDANKPTFNPDEEVEIELNGKKFLKKQGEILDLLEKNQGFSEKEKQLAQLEKQLNRDYTHKSQQLSEFKKSLETDFGVIPDKEEMRALGKVYRAYQTNPHAKTAIDQILNGGVATPAKGEELDANTQFLQNKIAELEDKLNGVTSSFQERQTQQEHADNKATWEKWEAEKQKSGIKITQEIDEAMTPWVKAIRIANPEWEKARVLEEAYAMATRGQTEQKAVKKVLLSVDEAKKKGVLKITPKTPGKSGKDQSYAELVSE